MRRRVRWLVVGAFVLATTSSSSAFELLRVGSTCGNSRNLFWGQARVDVDASRFASQYQALANEARLRWNEAVTGFDFGTGGGEFCRLDDAVTSLGFSSSDCGGGGLGDALAVTRLRWDDRTGELLDADTVFNVNSGLLGTQDIFRQVTMHELGHVMGLDHSDACGQSGVGTLMQSFLSASAPRITRPTNDDVAGANAIYEPMNGSPPPDGANSCAIDPTPSPWSGFVLAVPLAIFALFRRRAHNTVESFLMMHMDNSLRERIRNKS